MATRVFSGSMLCRGVWFPSFVVALLLSPVVAEAHIRLDVPKARNTPDLKASPCGDSAPGAAQELDGWVAGATVTVTFTETINHPSHYRIALSRTGDEAFEDPSDIDDKETDGLDLLDDIADEDAGNNREQSVDITLPNEPCESCVLQLIQVMYDKPATPFYYQCADIVIGPNPDASGTGGAPGSGGQANVGGTNVGGTNVGGEPEGAGGLVASGGASSGGGPASNGGALAAVGGAGSGGISAGSGSGGERDGGPASGGLGTAGGGGDGASSGAGCSLHGQASPEFGAAIWALLSALGWRGRRRVSRT